MRRRRKDLATATTEIKVLTGSTAWTWAAAAKIKVLRRARHKRAPNRGGKGSGVTEEAEGNHHGRDVEEERAARRGRGGKNKDQISVLGYINATQDEQHHYITVCWRSHPTAHAIVETCPLHKIRRPKTSQISYSFVEKIAQCPRSLKLTLFSLLSPRRSGPVPRSLATISKSCASMPPSCWFFRACWLLLPLVLAVAVAAAADQQAEAGCSGSGKRCGNLTISSPFWLIDIETGRSCGSLDFAITCLNKIPVLESSIPLSYGFKIIDISYEESRVRVVDLDKLRLLPASNSCDERISNISERLGQRFSADPVNLNLIIYNCTNASAAAAAAVHQDGGLVETRMRCRNESSEFVRIGGRYNASENYEGYYLEGCIANSLPVLGSSGEANASDYEQLISDGFLLTWDPPPPSGSGSKRTGRKIMIIVLTAAAATLLLACIYVLIWHRKGKRLWFILCKKTSSSTERNYEAMIVSYGSLAPKRYTYSDVMKITSSRSDQLGRGGYGVVFKGRLDDGRLVAVKFLHDCKGNGDEFVNEVMSIGRTSHVNVVSLFGFCLEGSKRALIYEYMPNGSLDKYIYSENPKETLGWERLYAIAIGIARGLEYLHHSCNTRIVHFDIKPQNILLDKDFCPKIADFGLAKLCHTKESNLSVTGARGTIGFIAPEVHSRTFGVVSTKSDVYSYGMMLLEMVGGRKNVNTMAEKASEQYFPDWIYDHFVRADGVQASDVTHEIEEMAKKMTIIGLWCIQILPICRPTIAKVLEMFERRLDEMDMPPKQNFSELIEDSAHNMSVQSASTSIPEDISLVNSEDLQQQPSL
uniref:Uncharacterized protein n=2 Tax=Avena sativa TaxID=4498 RepID=A0ACD5VE19_AVESA